MKSTSYQLSIIMMAILAVCLPACGPSTTTEAVDVELKLSGDMLFEGANSLQYSNESQLEELAAAVGSDIRSIKNVSVSAALLELDNSSRQITESLLLQIVSDNQELVSIGTLNPLPKSDQLKLSIAEDSSILPYLKDSGMTWVLNLNISEDYMDEMLVKGKLSLTIEYVPSNN